MYKKMLSSIFASLLILMFIVACGSNSPAVHHTIKPTPITKSAPMHVRPTVVSPTPTAEPVEGYLSSDNQRLLWIRWNESSPGKIQGIWHVAYYNLYRKTIKDFDAPFTGTLSGNSISINIHYSQFVTVLALGTLKGKNLCVTLSNSGKTIDAYGISQDAYKKSLQKFQTNHA